MRYKADQRPTLPFRYMPGLQVRQGSLIVLLAAPGVGKSFLSLSWAWDLAQQEMPVAYCNWDTPYDDQVQRIVALIDNKAVAEVDSREAERLLHEKTRTLKMWEPSVHVETLPAMMNALVEWFGQPPVLTIVDIVQDIIKGEDSPEKYQEAFNALHFTARKFRSTMLAIHHTNRSSSSGDGRIMPKRSDGRYGGEQRADIELGLCAPQENRLRLGVLKNRSGKSGGEHDLEFDPTRGRIG